MKKTFRERVLSRCKAIAKEHSYMKMPMLVVMTMFLSIYYLCMNIANNGKRYTSVCVVILFFFINSSFNFHGHMQMIPEEEMPMSEIQLTADDGDYQGSMEIEEDSEILENYDDVELVGEENLDTYTLDDILEENSSYLETPKGTKNDELDNISFDKDDFRIMLVNKQHPIPEDYEFPLGTIKGDLRCDERIIEDLLDMMQAAKDANVDLVICSPYRDYSRQTLLFEKKIQNYMKRGMSYMDAYKISSQSVTAPNASEHQMGLAIDFYSSTYNKLNAGFGDTETGKWLAAHAYEYGFILRYPLGKEYITGIEFEPWHFRYVGEQAAKIITESEITLEEFWEDYIE